MTKKPTLKKIIEFAKKCRTSNADLKEIVEDCLRRENKVYDTTGSNKAFDKNCRVAGMFGEKDPIKAGKEWTLGNVNYDLSFITPTRYKAQLVLLVREYIGGKKENKDVIMVLGNEVLAV